MKPTKSFKTSTPFQPPGVEVRKETSYSSTYKGEQGKLLNADNKLMDRRRIRSLYNEPSKEAAKVSAPQHMESIQLAAGTHRAMCTVLSVRSLHVDLDTLCYSLLHRHLVFAKFYCNALMSETIAANPPPLPKPIFRMT